MPCRIFLLCLLCLPLHMHAAGDLYQKLRKQADQDPQKLDYAALYDAYLQSDRLNRLKDFYALADNDARFNADKTDCIASPKVLREVLVNNYLSLAAHYAAMKCYDAQGKLRQADKHERALMRLFDGMFTQGDSHSLQTALPFVSYSDVQVFLYLSGFNLLGAYLKPAKDNKGFVFTAITRDEYTQRIAEQYFDNSRIVERYFKQQNELLKALPHLNGNLLIYILAQSDSEAAWVGAGDIYAEGWWEPQDFHKAAEYYQKGAAEDMWLAQTRLAYLYIAGRGVAQDFDTAIDLLLPGLEQGYADTEIAMAALYFSGLGVTQDTDAFRILMTDLSAQLGEVEAYLRVTQFMQQYLNDHQGAQLAIKLLQQTTIQSEAKILIRLGDLHRQQETPAGYKNAASYYEKAMSKNRAIAEHALGTLWATRQHGYNDLQKALHFYERGAQADYAPAQAQLCRHYHLGLGVKADQSTALRWCRQAAAQQDGLGLYYLGLLTALGVDADEQHPLQRQATLYTQAAQAGLALAQFNLAALLQSREEPGFVWYWFRRAATQGWVDAQYRLAHTYFYNRDFKAGRAYAEGLLQMAAQQAHIPALLLLGEVYIAQEDPQQAYAWHNRAMDLGSRAAISPQVLPQLETPLVRGILTDYELSAVEVASSELLDDELIAGVAIPLTRSHYKFKNFICACQEVPLQLGLRYGVTYQLLGLPDGEHELHLKIIHPSMQLPDGKRTQGGTFKRKFVVKDGVYKGNEAWLFEAPYELVPGEWRYELYYKNRIIFEHRFTTYTLN